MSNIGPVALGINTGTVGGASADGKKGAASLCV